MKSYAEKLLHQKDIQFTVSRVRENRRRKAQHILDHINFWFKKMLDVDETLVSRVDTKRQFSRCDGGGEYSTLLDNCKLFPQGLAPPHPKKKKMLLPTTL